MNHNKQQYEDITLVVPGGVCNDNIECLKRSIVREVNQAREVDSISERVFQC